RLDADLTELLLNEYREIDLERPRAGGQLEAQRLARPESGLGEQPLGVGAIALRVAETGQGRDVLRRESPEPVRPRRHRRAGDRAAVAQALHVGAAVERLIDRAADLDVV